MAEMLAVVEKRIQTAESITAQTFTDPVNIVGCKTISFVSQVTVVQAVTDCGATLQKSLGPSGPWFDEGAEQAITSTVDLNFPKVDPEMKWYRLKFDISAGEIEVTTDVLGKGDV